MSKIPLLEVKNCSKSFPGVQALDDVDFKLFPGHCTALVGENGAGKSTLIKIIDGAYQKDMGEIYINGVKVDIKDTKHAQHFGISVVHQELQLIPELNGIENIFLGKCEYRKFHLINWRKLNKKAKEILELLNYGIDLKIPVKFLRTPERQIIQLARALSSDTKILILDELTAMLQEKEIERIYKIIKLLKSRNIGIIYISHRLNEVFDICDRYTVLCDGKLVNSGDVKDINKDKLIEMMIGRTLSKVFPGLNKDIGETTLEIKNLTSKAYTNINLSVNKGEVVGIAGLVGAGKTELVNSFFGNYKYNSGEIRINRKLIKIDSPVKAIKNSIGLMPDERKRLGLIIDFSITNNVTLPSIRRYKKVLNIFMDKNREKIDTKEYIKSLNISCYSPSQRVVNLSGGNQQKVVLGKWLLKDSNILIFDEPTRGIDVGTKVEIYKIINNLSKKGNSIVIVSAEIEELIGLCHKIYIIFEGKLRGVVSGKNKTQENIIHYIVGEK